MVKKKKQKEQKLIAGFPVPWAVSGIAMMVIGALIIFPSLTFPFHVIRCGGLPITASKFMSGFDYYVPGDRGYLGIFNQDHFCTEDEAKAGGYDRTPTRTR